MLAFLFKRKTGYSIDRRYPKNEKCPICGGKVYHIKEDDNTVFCTAMLCNWTGSTIYPKQIDYQEMIKMQIRKQFENAYIPGRSLYLKCNAKYNKHPYPVIINDDVMNYRYIVRSFDFSAGISYSDPLYNEKTKPIAQYSTIDDMIEDGWRLD